MDGEGQVQFVQVECWEILDGGKCYIFYLCSGLQWFDGQFLMVEDFVFGWQCVVDLKMVSFFVGYLVQVYINNVAVIVVGKVDVILLGVKVMDDCIFEVMFEQLVFWFMMMFVWLMLFLVFYYVIVKYGDSWSKLENMVYNGVFVFDQWVVNEKIIVCKNLKYCDV